LPEATTLSDKLLLYNKKVSCQPFKQLTADFWDEHTTIYNILVECRTLWGKPEWSVHVQNMEQLPFIRMSLSIKPQATV